MQLWTIVAIDDPLKVLVQGASSSSPEEHPKDAGMPGWDEATMLAVPIDGMIDTASQRWNGSAWVADVDIARSRRWAIVRAARDAAQDGGCPTPLGRVDTDAESRGKISGSVQMAVLAQMAGDPFEVPWTMSDNRTEMHDGPAMIAMGVAVGRHVAACHAEGLIRRAAIDAAQDLEAIAAVPAEGGWPGAPD